MAETVYSIVAAWSLAVAISAFLLTNTINSVEEIDEQLS